MDEAADFAPQLSAAAKVEGWRLDELVRADFPFDIANRIAMSDADLHLALKLAANGCPHRLVAEILL